MRHGHGQLGRQPGWGLQPGRGDERRFRKPGVQRDVGVRHDPAVDDPFASSGLGGAPASSAFGSVPTNAAIAPRPAPTTDPLLTVRILLGALLYDPLLSLALAVSTMAGSDAVLSLRYTNPAVYMVLGSVLFVAGVLLVPTPWTQRGPAIGLGLVSILAFGLIAQGVLPFHQVTVALLGSAIFLAWCIAAIRRPIMWLAAGPGTLLLIALNTLLPQTYLGSISYVAEVLVTFALSALVALVPPAPKRATAAPTLVMNDGRVAPAGFAAPAGVPQFGVAPVIAPPTNTMAIVAFVVSFVFAPAGVVLGHLSLREIQRTGQDGRGLAIAALVISYLSIVTTLGFFLWVYVSLQSIGQGYGY